MSYAAGVCRVCAQAAVRVPEGCLLVQAGKQMEHVTGGRILAGFHEVRGAYHQGPIGHGPCRYRMGHWTFFFS